MKDEIFQEIANSIYSKLVGRGGEDTRLFADTIAEAIQEYDKQRTEEEATFKPFVDIPFPENNT